MPGQLLSTFQLTGGCRTSAVRNAHSVLGYSTLFGACINVQFSFQLSGTFVTRFISWYFMVINLSVNETLSISLHYYSLTSSSAIILSSLLNQTSY